MKTNHRKHLDGERRAASWGTLSPSVRSDAIHIGSRIAEWNAVGNFLVWRGAESEVKVLWSKMSIFPRKTHIRSPAFGPRFFSHLFCFAKNGKSLGKIVVFKNG